MASRRLGELRIGTISTDLLYGADAIPHEDRASYATFLREVVRQRGFPLHTASLWNALYFGWDLDRSGYLGRGMQTTLAVGVPVPVGAFVQVPVGTKGLLLAEVTYKEGRDERISGLGIAAPAASGARLGLLRNREEAAVREALVLDFKAFGEGFNEAEEIVRAQRRGLLNVDSHRVVEVRYPGSNAGADDLRLFALYVHAQYGDTLFNDLLRDGGAGVTEDERWELLVDAIAAVDEIATSTPGLRTFGFYHLDRDAYQTDRRQGGDAIFGAAAIETVARGAMRPPPARVVRGMAFTAHDESPSYRSTGALLREHLEAGGGLNPDEQALLTGPSYARLVLEANLAIADQLGADGLIADEHLHVRLDDDWQGGGIWRAVRYEGVPPLEARFGPLVPLGLGYAETSGEEGLAGITLAGVPPEPAERTDRAWRVPLRLIDLHYRDLPLDAEAVARLKPDATEVIVEISDGENPPRRKPRPLDRQRRVIHGMLWPVTFTPGTIVSYSVGLGGVLVSVRATPLPVPEERDGRTLRYEYNERVYLRDCRLLPLDSATLGRDRSLTDQINVVFRRRGRPTADGGRALRTEEIVAAILGPDYTPAVSLPIVLRLQIGEYEFRDGEYVWQSRMSRRTSPRERTRIVAAREHREATLRRILAPRQVSMGIRHLSTYHPRPAHVARYQWALNTYHMRGRLLDELAPNDTWVRPFELGSVEAYRTDGS
jgi:hypothetical protein